ncbi:class I SAM-dependent methyltransferase, partial [[Clostridium] innocuum]|nr:class I SAM-dependent methyltransferase [[Clostridium] innocuum]
MKKLFTIAMQKPALYETSKDNIWSDPHTVKRMLKAHLDTTEDSATRRIETVEKAIDWISRQFPAERYPTLLDLGCGPGVYTERFCKKGYAVTGVDFSEHSITYAMHSARQQQLSIHYLCADYTQLHMNSRFHIITLIYCDFGVLSAVDRKKL